MHRLDRLDEGTHWHLGPPRQRYEEASLTVALASPSRIDGIAVLAAGVQWRRTVAHRLAANLASRPRVPDRAFWQGVLDDVATGACSVLEQGFLDLVERPHDLPRMARQVREVTPSGVVYRDARLGGLVVELDGRLHHDSASTRDRDMERDLDAAIGGDVTVRLSYGQVFDRACATARKLGALHRLHGWDGRPHACGPACAAA